MAIIASTTLLNKYKVVQEIGQGGMGRVWLAEELAFGNRLVAIKESRSDLPPSEVEEVQRRYKQEVQIYAALQKVQAPNIVPVYTVEPYEQSSLLIMAYMSNGDLDRLLRQNSGGLPIDQSLAITLSVLQALQSAHEHPLEIVHRDIKPSNILFDAANKPYLADFGLAQLGGTSERSQLPGGRIHPGTPAYMPPEQANSAAYLTPAADIYAVGCVLFEMLSGKRYKRLRPGTKPSSIRQDVPPWVDTVVCKAVAEDQFDRYEDAGEMITALNAERTYAGAELDRQRQAELEKQRQAEAEKQRRSKDSKANDATNDQARQATAAPTLEAQDKQRIASGQSVAEEGTGSKEDKVNVAAQKEVREESSAGTAVGKRRSSNWLKAVIALVLFVPGVCALSGIYGSYLEQQKQATAEPIVTTPAPTEAATKASTDVAAETSTEAAAETPAAGGPSLTIWTDALHAPVFETQGQKFADQYGGQLIVVQKDFNQLRNDFKVAASTGGGPDILFGAHDWIGELNATGLLAPIELGDKAASFAAPAVAAFTYPDGKLYGMPQAVENIALVYNTDLMPTPPATFDELVTMSKAIKDAGTKYGFLRQAGDPYHFYPIQTAFGGYIFGKNADGSYNAKDLGLNSPGSVAALEWLDKMYKDGLLDVGANIDGNLMVSAFQNGDAAAIITGPWSLPGIREAKVPYKVAVIPTATEAGRPFMGVQGFMVNAFSKNQLLAQTFLQEFVASDETMQAFYDADPRVSAWTPIAEKIADPDVKVFMEAGKNADPMPNIPEMNAVWQGWGDAITQIDNGTIAPQAAADQAQQQVETAIAGSQ